MSDNPHMGPGERECSQDVAAYALGALDRDEAVAFRDHLESCPVCRDELASFQEVVNALPLSAPAHRAPGRLRRRVVREVRREARSGRPARRPTMTLGGSGWLRPAVVAVAVLAVIALAVLRFGPGSGSSSRVLTAHVTGRGNAQLRLSSGHGELILRHFSPPPRGKIYEVWVKRPHEAPQATSALFSVTTAGSGDVEVPGHLPRSSLVMVTPEPQGGSRMPTHPPVLSVSIS